MTIFERDIINVNLFFSEEFTHAFYSDCTIEEFKEGIIYVRSINEEAALSEHGFSVGSVFERIELESIVDVKMTEGQNRVSLSAVVKNPVENLKLYYQWYRLDSVGGEPEKIYGATESTYTVEIASNEEAYFYCEVKSYYGDVITASTSNGTGNPKTEVYNTDRIPAILPESKNLIAFLILRYTFLPFATALIMVAKLSSVRIIAAASFDTSVPVMPIATPISAFFNAGASFTPSPVIATIVPFFCHALTI